MSSQKLERFLEKFIFSPQLKEVENGNIKFITSYSIVDGIIDDSRIKKTSYNKDLKAYYVKKGDIIFQSKGYKFSSIIVDGDYEQTVVSQMYYILRIKKGYDSEYINWFLNSRIATEYFNQVSTTGLTKFISKRALLNLDIYNIFDELNNKKDTIVNLVKGFREEKELTLAYLREKEKLINEKIIQNIEGENK